MILEMEEDPMGGRDDGGVFVSVCVCLELFRKRAQMCTAIPYCLHGYCCCSILNFVDCRRANVSSFDSFDSDSLAHTHTNTSHLIHRLNFEWHLHRLHSHSYRFIRWHSVLQIFAKISADMCTSY